MIENNPIIHFLVMWVLLLSMGPVIRQRILMYGRGSIFKSDEAHVRIFDAALRGQRPIKFGLVTLIASLATLAAYYSSDEFILMGIMLAQIFIVAVLECALLIKIEVDARDATKESGCDMGGSAG